MFGGQEPPIFLNSGSYKVVYISIKLLGLKSIIEDGIVINKSTSVCY